MHTTSALTRRPGWWIGRLLLGALLFGAPGLAAQQLPLKRNDPSSDPFTCPTLDVSAVPSPEERAQAGELASLAGEAVVVGDLDRAQALLARATQLDPTSPEFAYRRARLGEDTGDRATAVTEFCRVLAVGAEPDAIADARTRLANLAGPAQAEIPVIAIEKYREGLALADQGQLQDAVESFAVAIARGPIWADAYFNSAVIWMRLGQRQQAEQDLIRYLALRPDAPDAVAVARRLGRMEGLGAIHLPEPGVAMTLGMLAPGLGQFYSGRALGGLTVLSLTGSAVAIGVLAKQVDTVCRISLSAGDSCPASQVDETVRRPYLVPSILAATAISLGGAIEAMVKARRRPVQTDVVAAAPEPGRARIVGPSVSTAGLRSDLTLIGLTFD